MVRTFAPAIVVTACDLDESSKCRRCGIRRTTAGVHQPCAVPTPLAASHRGARVHMMTRDDFRWDPPLPGHVHTLRVNGSAVATVTRKSRAGWTLVVAGVHWASHGSLADAKRFARRLVRKAQERARSAPEVPS